MRVCSRFLLSVPVLLLLTAGPARAQAPPVATPGSPSATPDVVAGPAAPSWLVVPALPEGWRVREADAESVTFAGGDAELTVARRTGSANEVLAALAEQAGAAVGGSPSVYHLSVGGPWVQGRLVEAARGGSERAVVGVRRLPGDQVLTAVARGSERGRGVGEALDLLARVRLAGDDAPPPLAPLDLTGRPEARINPVGVFVTLPEGWKPELVKGEPVFWIRGPNGRIRFAKAGAAEIRGLSSLEDVAEDHPGRVVQPLFWRPPGSYRAWQVLEVKDDEVVSVRNVHLVRYKKLDDWTWHLVEVEGVEPGRGFAEVRSVLSRLKKIP